jgi:peptidoglycan-associated lipoprotein
MAAVALASVGGLAACHSPEPQSPSQGLTSAATPPQPPDLGRGASRADEQGPYHVYVAEPVRKECSGSVPFFDFDSSTMGEGDQPSMQTLADCMLTGPLKGKRIKLIGHTDPRGTADYNEKLGLERADRVKAYLVKHGVQAERVDVASAGENQASDAPKDWPKDRRVQIQLAP